MAEVRITGLHKEYRGRPPTTAANNLNLTIDDGEFLVLLGPSGCGKTTTLRCLAGLEAPDAGHISIGGKTVMDVSEGIDFAPERRDIGMCFQSYALWPHMTVRRNIEYPLRARKLSAGLNGNWVEETAKLVEVEGLLDRYPGQMSGGQQQRVALARALVARPGLVLFDEPLSNLDARLRDQVRNQLHHLHNQLNFTAVFVTHDQTEALSLADRIAVMNKGSIEQLDTAQRIFEEPATEYVAAFMGMTERLDLTLSDGEWRAAGARLSGMPESLRTKGETRLVARIRPADIYVEPAGTGLPAGQIGFEAEVEDVVFAGRYSDVVLKLGEHRLQGRTLPGGGNGGLVPGETALVRVAAHLPAFYGASAQRIACGARS